VNAQDARGWTALMLAARYGHAHIADFLLKSGSDQAIHNMTGQTAIDIAQFWRRKEAYDVLKSRSLVAGIDSSSFTSNPSLSSGIDRCSELRSDSAWLLETMKREDSIFIAMHDGQPVVTLDDKTLGYQLLRMNYLQVQPYISENVVVFLGLHQERSDKLARKFRITSETGNGKLLRNEEKRPNTDSKSLSELIEQKQKSRQKESGSNKSSDSSITQSVDVQTVVQTPAYFGIDLTDLPVTQLKFFSEKATVLSSFRFIGLKGHDDALVKQARPLLDWHSRHGYCASCASPTTLIDGGYKRVCLNRQCITHTG